jgi:non-specific serine/threonine protein kinase
VVLHLVDCSLLAPPRTGPDGRARYLMLETLRAYGLERLAEAGEQTGAAASLARHALAVAEQAAAGLQVSGGELAAARWLDAEDATTQHVLTWALDHDPGTALHLAIALAPWWLRRGRSEAGYTVLRAVAGHAAGGEDMWRAGQLWLGLLADSTSDLVASLSHFTAVRDAAARGGPSPELVVALGGRSAALRNLGRVPEAAENARRALALAQDLGYQAGEALALHELSWAANYAGDFAASLKWAQQACQIDPAGIPDWVARWCGTAMTVALLETGQAASAQRSCADWLTRTRDAGDLQEQAMLLWLMAELDRTAGRMADARGHLRETLRIASRIGDRLRLADCLDTCGHICAATGRCADAITMWAARAAHKSGTDTLDPPPDARRRQEPMRKAAQALGHARTRAAEARGAAMSLATAAEFAATLIVEDRQTAQPPGLPQLSAREQELVTLVARGHTDTQIAAQLYISVRTVRSHLDRIRDKTSCRRRADLTRLALHAGLI